MLLHTRHRYIYFHRQLSYNLYEDYVRKILLLLYNDKFRFQANRESYWFYNKNLVFVFVYKMKTSLIHLSYCVK